MLMDDIDRKILKLLQENARMSLKTIAEKTFLSSPAVSARIEKLEKDGVIAGYHAMVDPMKLGYHILAFINLDVIPEASELYRLCVPDNANNSSSIVNVPFEVSIIIFLSSV